MQDVARIITRTFYIPGTKIPLNINPLTIGMSWLVIFIILILAFFLARRLKTIPSRRQVAVEFLVGWFDGILKETMGEDGRKFLPLVMSLFLFVLISNWLAVIPGLSAPTRDLNTCLGLGLLVFFISHGSAIKKKGLKGYLAGYFKPHWLLFISNIFSEIGKLLSHSFRLFGNIFAGGIVISVVPFILLKIFRWAGIPFGIVGMPILKGFFGIFIGAIQAFVFSMLAMAYIGILREE